MRSNLEEVLTKFYKREIDHDELVESLRRLQKGYGALGLVFGLLAGLILGGVL